ncbi:MAG: hypothetical protein Q9164_004325 [Protoblastenia rupestris]
MAPLLTHLALLISATSFLSIATASTSNDIQRVPLGGSLFSLDTRHLFKRAGEDLGSDCGGDPACSTTDFGCACAFADDSWIEDAEEEPPKEEPPKEEPPKEEAPKEEPKPPRSCRTDCGAEMMLGEAPTSACECVCDDGERTEMESSVAPCPPEAAPEESPKENDDAPTEPDMSSPACEECLTNNGSSDCPAPDLTCLQDQCRADKSCQECGVDCSTVGVVEEPPKEEDDAPTEPDMSSPACEECLTNNGSSDCPAPDLTCLQDQCRADKSCQECGMDCSTVGVV